MTVSETDRRRRRLLVRSLAGGNCLNQPEPFEVSHQDAPDGPQATVCAAETMEHADPGRHRPQQTLQAPAAQFVPVGPIRVLESQLDSVLRALGALGGPPKPGRRAAAPRHEEAVPAPSDSFLLPPFQSLPARRPVPGSQPRLGGSAARPATAVTSAPTVEQRLDGAAKVGGESVPPAVQPGVALMPAASVDFAEKPASVPLRPDELPAASGSFPSPVATLAPLDSVPLTSSATLEVPHVAELPVRGSAVARRPMADVPAAAEPAPVPPVRTEIPAATISVPAEPQVTAAELPDLAERSAALRSRSKIGVMKQDAVALSARLKELARFLEESPDAPSDDALCAWDDCRRLALMLHHELDRGVPQAEPQRGVRPATRAR